MSFLNKTKGLVFGAAVGDAIGFIAEYQNRELLEKFIQELFNGELKTLTHRTYPKDYSFGQISDDTQFSLILLENLFNYNTLNEKAYLDSLKDSYSQNKLVGLGKNTKKILSNQSNLTNNSSNGSLMRSYPIGAFFKSEEEIKKYSKLQSQITHNHEESILASQVYALTIFDLMKNKDKESVRKRWNNLLKDISWLDFSLEEFISYLQKNYKRDKWDYVPPGALVSIKACLYSFYNSDKFNDCLRLSLFLGGDTDTVSSLSCGLMGLDKGYSSIPKKWVNSLNDDNKSIAKVLDNWSKNLADLHKDI